MKKSACIEMLFTEVNFYDRFKAARKAGFDYVEFWTWDDKDITEISRQRKKHNLKIASFSGDKAYNLVDIKEKDKYLNFLAQSIETAHKLGCKNLVIHSNALGEKGVVVNHFTEIPYEVRIDNIRQILKEADAMAIKENVRLMLEPLNTVLDHVGNTLGNIADAAGIIRDAGFKNIKVLYDIYHMQINEGNLISTISEYKDSIGYFHVADVPGRHEPGTGEINYKNIFKTLSLLNYKGFIGFELSPKSCSDKAVKSIMKL